jgi:hypothetical protein
MTISAPREETPSVRHSVSKVALFNALWRFSSQRNAFVEQGFRSGVAFTNSAIGQQHRDFVANSNYNNLFPAGVSNDERFAKLREVYDVAISLRTDVETVEAEDARIMAGDFFKEGLTTTGENGVVVESKIDAVVIRCDGVFALEAFALLCGYSIDEVMGVTDAVMHEAYEFVSRCGVQLPWAVLMECLSNDIDPSLASSLPSVL